MTLSYAIHFQPNPIFASKAGRPTRVETFTLRVGSNLAYITRSYLHPSIIFAGKAVAYPRSTLYTKASSLA